MLLHYFFTHYPERQSFRPVSGWTELCRRGVCKVKSDSGINAAFPAVLEGIKIAEALFKAENHGGWFLDGWRPTGDKIPGIMMDIFLLLLFPPSKNHTSPHRNCVWSIDRDGDVVGKHRAIKLPGWVSKHRILFGSENCWFYVPPLSWISDECCQ